MYEYKKNDIQKCFQQRRLVFVGDSTTRQVFWAVAKKVDPARADKEMSDMLYAEHKHTDLDFYSGDIKIEFIWDPYLNSSKLEHELRKFRPEPLTGDRKSEDDSAGLILVGAPGLWYARHGNSTNNYFSEFRDSIERVIPYMDHPNSDSTWDEPEDVELSPAEPSNFLMMAPVQVPRYELLSPSRAATITPQKIDQMNDYLQQASAHSFLDVVWSYSTMTAQVRNAYEESGIHVIENVALQRADILLNLRCNAVLHSHPFNRTCCSNYRKLNGVQWIIALTGILGLPVLWIGRYRRIVKIMRLLPSRDSFNALIIFVLVICYCYLADRTQFFEKAQKHFQLTEFYTGCLVASAIGLISIRRINLPRSSIFGPHRPVGSGPIKTHTVGPLPRLMGWNFLSRDQTDEWKGWMQALILVYHYTHGSQTLWIYEIVRVLVAAYLFMTGYGHTLHFITKEDYSLRRLSYVLIRSNLLSWILPYVMRTDYQFYYFAPLVSFWFTVVYLTMRIGHRRNTNLAFVLWKVLCASLLTTALMLVPGIAEMVAGAVKHTFMVSLDLKEWRFRTCLDMYIVYCGMVLAILYHKAISREEKHWLLRIPSNYPAAFKLVTVVAALISFPLFWILSQTHTKKEDFNKLQPYMSCIPILAFVVLRNSHDTLRNYHSTAFAWLGRCSLETYILQYHIWLAGDTTGLLRTGLFNRHVDFVILTPIFIWISWLTARVTQTITTWIVDDGRIASEGGKQNSPLFLPTQTPIEEGTPSKHLRFDFARRGWLSTLQWRLLAIGVMMWIGNVTYA